MAKAPAFQFYVRDWLSDPQLKMASHQSKGIWIDLLCYMWEAPERGNLTGTVQEYCRMIGTTEPEFLRFLDEAKRLKFASVTESNGKVTLENRRMMREEKERKNNALRQSRFKSNAKSNADSNEKVTSPSSSSSSSSSSKQKKKPIADAPKKGTSPNPEIKLFLDYAFDTFQQTFSEKMLIDGGKDSSLIKKLLSTYSFDRLKELWDVFMKSDDPFICQAGRTIGVFKTQINKLISGDSGSGSQKSLFQQTESPIDKAMKRM